MGYGHGFFGPGVTVQDTSAGSGMAWGEKRFHAHIKSAAGHDGSGFRVQDMYDLTCFQATLGCIWPASISSSRQIACSHSAASNYIRLQGLACGSCNQSIWSARVPQDYTA